MYTQRYTQRYYTIPAALRLYVRHTTVPAHRQTVTLSQAHSCTIRCNAVQRDLVYSTVRLNTPHVGIIPLYETRMLHLNEEGKVSSLKVYISYFTWKEYNGLEESSVPKQTEVNDLNRLRTVL